MDSHALRALRQEMGLSQFQLAEASGLSQGYLSQLEAGDVRSPSLYVALGLARGLGVPFCALLARLGLACGCERDWGELSRHPVMELFGQLSPHQARLLTDLMKTMGVTDGRGKPPAARG